MVRSPSKFLSIKFLQALKEERYLSPTGKEYCAEEVDDLLNQKLCDYASRCEAEYMKELSRRALEAEASQLQEGDPFEIYNSGFPQGGYMETKEAEVLSIEGKLKAKQERQRELDRLKCCDCGHELANEDEWLVGADLPVSREHPRGTQDSGIFVCPKCYELQEHTVFDGMVTMDTETGDLSANIPGFLIAELMGQEFSEKGARFNVGQAILNTQRALMIKHFGEDAADTCFPVDKAWLMENFGG